MSTTKKYWRGLPELHQSPEFIEKSGNEFAEELPLENLAKENTEGTSRRDFLKVMGFTTAAAALASCETPVIKAIPYVVKPEEVTPGIANWYASTFYDGHDYASVLVKTREGRPIKVEGNENSKITKGGSSARSQASVLSLYDDARLKGPVEKGNPTTWKNADAAIGSKLAAVSGSGSQIVILSSTVISPSTKAVFAEFSSKYPGAKLVQYDAVSYSAIRSAHEKVFGKKAVPSFDFSKAEKAIVSFSCDFLGTWLSPTEFASGYSQNRKVSNDKKEMSKHFQFETNLSLTGANADERYMLKPSEIGKAVVALYNEVAKNTGNSSAGSATTSDASANAAIVKAAKVLCENKGKSLVVCGLNNTDVQVMVCGINKMLDNYGQTLDLEAQMNTKQGDDKDFIDLVADMNAGKVGAILFYNSNPVYTSGSKTGFTAALPKVGLKVSFSSLLDETALACDYVCPDNHWLESWGDANPKRGHYSLQQPTISPLFTQPRHEGTRQVQDTLLNWAGVKSDYLTYLQAYWQNHVFPMQGKYGNFFDFWSNSLHDGVLKVNIAKPEVIVAPMAKDSTGKPLMTGVAMIAESISDSLAALAPKVEVKEEKKDASVPVETTTPQVDYNAHAAKAVAGKSGTWEIQIYEKISLGNGNQSNNPWLHEMPDPISKVTWDNYITMNPEDVKAQGFNEMLRQDIIGSVASLTVNGVAVELPVYPQPGQAKGTIGVALGYGRNAESLKVAMTVGGANAFAFTSITDENISFNSSDVNIAKTDKKNQFASTQIQHTIMGREEYLLRETSLKQYQEDSKSNNPSAFLATHSGPRHVNDINLWNDFPRPGHHWAMSIDMNSCIGCSACVVSCVAENNTAIVGKDQIARTRDMFWLRIDRYYSSDMNKIKAEEENVAYKQMYLDMENPSNNPKVTFQPMMCQHCNHAPCETVCPVLATNHSNEGVNQMAYNRCIGTRYCANNCPFKVRRFNWYNYNENPMFAGINPSNTDYGRMVLNPDVVVRVRGVMEKCSMCAQRTQEAKLTAKKSGSPLKDGDVKTACQQACPTNAIVFGDINDKESQVSKNFEDDRSYFLLEELGVKPNIKYMVKVRNQEEEIVWEKEPVKTLGATENKEEKKEA